MKLLKKSLFASFVVQIIIFGIVAVSTYTGTEQSGVLLLFPFIAGVQIGPLLMQPLIDTMSPDVLLNVAMAAAVVSNFLVYAAIFYGWFMLRDKFSASKNLPSLA